MTSQTCSDLCKKLSVDYIVDVSQDDISLAREVREMYSDIGDFVDFIGEHLDGNALGLFESLKLTVQDFPDREHKEPIVLNSLVLLMFITNDRRLKKITSSYLRNTDIHCITALLDKYFPDV